MRILILIPAYNEGPHIAEVVRAALGHGHDVVVIDDCSSDDTGQRAAAAGAQVIRHKINGGKGKAIRTGFVYAMTHGFEAVLTLDGDGQHDPREIPRLVAAADDPKVDIVIGTRMRDTRIMPRVRLLTNRFLSLWISLIAHAKVTDSQSGYRLVKTSVWGTFPMQSNSFDFESEFLIRAGRLGYRVVEVPVSTIYGDEVSKINPWVETLRFIHLFMRASRFPAGELARLPVEALPPMPAVEQLTAEAPETVAAPSTSALVTAP